MCAEMPMFLILANSLRSDEKYLSGAVNVQADFRRSGLRNFNITELKFIFDYFNFGTPQSYSIVLAKE
jgi:hypothetical protein